MVSNLYKYINKELKHIIKTHSMYSLLFKGDLLGCYILMEQDICETALTVPIAVKS